MSRPLHQRWLGRHIIDAVLIQRVTHAMRFLSRSPRRPSYILSGLRAKPSIPNFLGFSLFSVFVSQIFLVFLCFSVFFFVFLCVSLFFFVFLSVSLCFFDFLCLSLFLPSTLRGEKSLGLDKIRGVEDLSVAHPRSLAA